MTPAKSDMRDLRLILAVAALCPALAACGAPPQHTAGVPPASVASPATTPAAATLANPKIAPALAAMARKLRAAPTNTAAAALTTAMVRVNDRREIQIYIHVTRLAPEIEQAIGEAGANSVRASKPLGLYQAWASPAALARIADLPEVTRISPPVYGFPQGGRR